MNAANEQLTVAIMNSGNAIATGVSVNGEYRLLPTKADFQDLQIDFRSINCIDRLHKADLISSFSANQHDLKSEISGKNLFCERPAISYATDEIWVSPRICLIVWGSSLFMRTTNRTYCSRFGGMATVFRNANSHSLRRSGINH
jgi:hypothetical protein